MDGQWLTYGEAAARLGVSIDAIRRRACRGHWARITTLQTDLAAERTRADKAIADLTALAQRLADLAARPWWRRIAG